ncbi:hypothetical protein A2159_01525 [Candidatus Woesebacteria bacterium RBG_13_34_9]|uniref:Polysaccharide biosynthesis protein C-terminal domain-containing protein n=1 Tax=Candidatus Woesebacteria bacterium RBG_13_34_9 TaxID=1802477 RepID=A0A1F7X5T3_9BACT|nr:MAG: hypothetical protein A2159_01525 [Candidatus Woesebacteria bacterium RBG_13_34_9]
MSSMIASFLGGIVLSSLFARIWPSDIYGQYSFLNSAIAFVSILALPGMSAAIVQAVVEGKEGFFKRSVKIVGKFSIIGGVILLCGSVYFYFRQNLNLALATGIAAFAFPLVNTGGLYASFFAGRRNFKTLAILNTSAQYISILATSLALLKFPSLVMVALFSNWSTAIFNTFVLFFTIRKLKNNRDDKKLEKLGITLSFGSTIILGVDYFDRFMIPVFLGFSQNAIYAFAILIPLQIHSFFKIFSSLAQPKITDISEKNIKKDLIKKSLQLEVVVAIIVIAYIFSAPTIFKILYPQYQNSAVFLSQMFSLTLLYYPINLFGFYLIKKRAIRKGLLSSVIYGIVSVSSLLIFLPLWGLIGAVVAKIVTRIIQIVIVKIVFDTELKTTRY